MTVIGTNLNYFNLLYLVTILDNDGYFGFILDSVILERPYAIQDNCLFGYYVMLVFSYFGFITILGVF